MKIKNKTFTVAILLILISCVCFGQGSLGGPPPPTPPPPPGLPIDGGLVYGMAFALFYGIKKLCGKRQS